MTASAASCELGVAAAGSAVDEYDGGGGGGGGVATAVVSAAQVEAQVELHERATTRPRGDVGEGSALYRLSRTRGYRHRVDLSCFISSSFWRSMTSIGVTISHKSLIEVYFC